MYNHYVINTLKQTPTEIRAFAAELEFSEIPDSVNSSGIRNVHTTSALFRGENLLPIAVAECLRRSEGEGELSVISIGCSMGAEVDSVLALCNGMDQPPKLEVLGIDANPKMIEIARNGLYSVGAKAQSIGRVRKTLAELGFLTPDGWHKREDMPDDYMAARINPIEVRRGHSVHFSVDDIRQPVLVDKKANLVLINNVLFHWPTSVAENIIRNTASLVAPNGVLSIGDADMCGIENKNGRSIAYRKFVKKKLTNILRDEFGLEPVAETPRGTPAVFASST